MPGCGIGDGPGDEGTMLPVSMPSTDTVHLMEVCSVCLRNLGTLRKPKGLATNKESLSPLCRSQLASLRDNLMGSISTKGVLREAALPLLTPEPVAGLGGEAWGVGQ